MLPILFSLGPVKIYSFGVFLACALLWSLFVLWKQTRLTSYNEEDIFDTVFFALFIGAIVSRIVYVAFHFNTFGFNILKFILVNGYPGGSLPGFIVGLYFAFIVLCIRRGIEPKKIIDYTITPIFVALSLGKIGSFLSGVDVGTITKLPVGVIYIGYTGIRHIVAFYEAVLFLISSLIASRILLAIRREMLPQFANFFWFLTAYGFITFSLDKIKENHIYFFGMSFSLLVGIVAFIIGSVYFIYIKRTAIYTFLKNIVKKLHQYGHNIFKKRASGNTTESNPKSKKNTK